MIGQYPIHLLGHGAIKGAQPASTVRDTGLPLTADGTDLRCHQGTGNVELTSPTTITMSDFCSRSTASNVHDFSRLPAACPTCASETHPAAAYRVREEMRPT